jgi:hypothetical protein
VIRIRIELKLLRRSRIDVNSERDPKTNSLPETAVVAVVPGTAVGLVAVVRRGPDVHPQNPALKKNNVCLKCHFNNDVALYVHSAELKNIYIDCLLILEMS